MHDAEPTISRCLRCDEPYMLQFDPGKENACCKGFTRLYTMLLGMLNAAGTASSSQVPAAGAQNSSPARVAGCGTMLPRGGAGGAWRLPAPDSGVLPPPPWSTSITSGLGPSSETRSGCCPHARPWPPCGARATGCCCCACPISKSMGAGSWGSAVASAALLGGVAEAVATAAASSWGGAPQTRSRVAGGAELGAACACSCSRCPGTVSMTWGPTICSAC